MSQLSDMERNLQREKPSHVFFIGSIPFDYTAVSPSGCGIHCIVTGKVPKGGRRIKGIEVDSGRFFTMTFAHLSSTRNTIEDSDAELKELDDDDRNS
jgi:putative DNA primase/helicase